MAISGLKLPRIAQRGGYVSKRFNGTISEIGGMSDVAGERNLLSKAEESV